MTKKAALINRLNFLSAEEKDNVISFFNKYPVYENRIDWNSKTLKFKDFKKVFTMADTSKNKQKKEAKGNYKSLFKGYNCRVIEQTKRYVIVMPLDWECAVFLNSFDCGDEGAKWCIGEKNNFYYWNEYISYKNLFYFILFKEKHPEYGKKIILKYNIENQNICIWDTQDNEINLEESILELIRILITTRIETLQENDFPKEADPDYALSYILRLAGKGGFPCPEAAAVIQAFSGLLNKKFSAYSMIQTKNIYNRLKEIYEKIAEQPAMLPEEKTS